MANDYADIFGRKQLQATSIKEPVQMEEPARWVDRCIPIPAFRWAQVQSVPIMSIALVLCGGLHHFVNIQDVNTELQRVVDNDVEEAKREFITRIDEMFTEYRRAGKDVYMMAMERHKREKEKKQREHRKQEEELKKRERARAREDRQRKAASNIGKIN